MSNITNVVAIVAVAALAITAVSFKRKAKAAKPQLVKLTQEEQHEAVMDVVRTTGDANFIESMDIVGTAINFNNLMPLGKIVK